MIVAWRRAAGATCGETRAELYLVAQGKQLNGADNEQNLQTTLEANLER